LEILKVIIGNIAIKAKAIDCSRNINSTFSTKPVNEERHLNIAINICVIQTIRNIISQNRVIIV
jgi:hypothetical protein